MPTPPWDHLGERDKSLSVGVVEGFRGGLGEKEKMSKMSGELES